MAKLQHALVHFSSWIMNWNIKLNKSKPVRDTSSLRCRKWNLYTYFEGSHIYKAASRKYLGFHLDNRLNWKHLDGQMAKQIKLQKCQLFLLTGHYSKLILWSKSLINQSIVKPITEINQDYGVKHKNWLSN